MIDSSVLLVMPCLPLRVRVCVCVGLTLGCGVDDISLMIDCHKSHVEVACLSLVKQHALSRERKVRSFVYHLTKVGRELIASEVDRLRLDALRIVGVARLERYARLSLLDEVERDLKGL